MKITRSDRIRGSLLGGAMGDALGYPVEFMHRSGILQRYGEKGITAYEYDRLSGKALISDDTQMTLFTAEGMLTAAAAKENQPLYRYVAAAYQNWLITQEQNVPSPASDSRLMLVPELYSRRAPGNTCLSALYEARLRPLKEDPLSEACNHSKGCGGIMRVAPLGLCLKNPEAAVMEGARMAAITHGHSLGYLSAAMLTGLLNRILYAEGENLEQKILDTLDMVCALFSDDSHLEQLRSLTELAIALAKNDDSDAVNIPLLGKGWVGEETLAISLYCALRYELDFSAGLIASVNHDGDSDSTGAVTGNILGALRGYDALEEKWKQNLELKEVLLETADALSQISGR